MGGISNFQIENAIKKIGDEHLSKNFDGIFPSYYMNKFINHATMIEDKKENTLLSLQTPMQTITLVLIGGAYLTLNLEMKFFSLILSVLMV